LDARVAFSAMQYYQSVKILQELQNKNYNEPELFILMSKSYLKLNEYDKAEKSATKALGIIPDSLEVRQLLDDISNKKIEAERLKEEPKKDDKEPKLKDKKATAGIELKKPEDLIKKK
jgi:hypothetical protein